MNGGKRLAAKKGGFFALLERMGVTNCLGFLLVFLLLLGLVGGFVLAVLSIKYQYTGALACWTVVFTPIGTAISIVLVRIVDKSRAENTSADGEGIKYAAAKATTLAQACEPEASLDSPALSQDHPSGGCPLAAPGGRNFRCYALKK